MWFESDIFLSFLSFNLISRLLERRRLLLGGTPSLHMPTYLTDVDPPVNDAYLGIYLLHKALRVMILCNRTRQ